MKIIRFFAPKTLELTYIPSVKQRLNILKLKIMKNQVNEIFKAVSSNSNYEVSNLGNVRNSKGQILTPAVNSSGYYIISLYMNGEPTQHTIHSLVAQEFKNHKPSGHRRVVDHIDGNKLNNNLDNLQILSQRQNCTKDKHKGNYSSKYVGVSFVSATQKWMAAIRFDGNKIALGTYSLEETAAKVYQLVLSAINTGNSSEYVLTEINKIKAQYKEPRKQRVSKNKTIA